MTTNLSTRSLTPADQVAGIQSLSGFSKLVGPLAQTVLYHRQSTREASPKAISGRTSYLRVRLEFLPYPQLIPCLFNDNEFGPPRAFTPASPWPWIDHPVSGLQPRTGRPIQTRFRYGSGPVVLNLARRCNSPVHSSIGTHSGFYSPRTACRRTVSGSLSLRSRGAFHLSLTVLVHYRSLRSL